MVADDSDPFTPLFRACTRSAVHLEMRDGYMRDDPWYIDWQAGIRHSPTDRASWWAPWHDLTLESAGRGVVIRRARVVSEPISDYVRYEYDITFTNIVAGEQVRWLPRRLATDIALPGNDFWLFDDETLLINHFSGDGDSTGHDIIRDPDVVKLCSTAFEMVWARGTPHDDYRPA
ncbi:MAG TPA: hypothetical protein VF062_28930 [Candidatus Limnocylindrales bacterium]